MRSYKKKILHGKRGGLKVRRRGSKERDREWEESEECWFPGRVNNQQSHVQQKTLVVRVRESALILPSQVNTVCSNFDVSPLFQIHDSDGYSVEREQKDRARLKNRINVFEAPSRNRESAWHTELRSWVEWGGSPGSGSGSSGWNLVSVEQWEQIVLSVKCGWEPASPLWRLRQWWAS